MPNSLTHDSIAGACRELRAQPPGEVERLRNEWQYTANVCPFAGGHERAVATVKATAAELVLRGEDPMRVLDFVNEETVRPAAAADAVAPMGAIPNEAPVEA